MSPFAILLRELRLRHGLKQRVLAEEMGYETSFFSALEVGAKGPPPPEFVTRLMNALKLNPAEREQVLRAAAASQRKLQIDNNCPPDVFLMINELQEAIGYLHPIQVKLIRDIIALPAHLAGTSADSTGPLDAKRG